MKTHLSLITLALLAAALIGCSPTQAEDDHQHAEAATAAHYKEGHGVQLSPGAATFVGLTTAEVAAQPVGAAGTVPAIPATALLRTVKGDFVYVVNGDWYLRTPVTAGNAHDDRIEIRDGLYEGDVVVSVGVEALWLAELQAVNGGVGCADGH
jgi:multidrug efflux pump subunit AcrA (membrane-fusion protein)